MAHTTIESLVSTLRQEGLEAGRQAGAEALAQAKAEAAALLAQAERTAAERIRNAEEQAASLLSKAQGDLKLAVRDTIARLRERLGTILARLLARPVDAALREPQVLAEAIVALIQAYAQTGRGQPDELRLPADLKDRIVAVALGRIREALTEGRLAEAPSGSHGFSYRLQGATVSVDRQSVLDHLMDLVNPELRRLLETDGQSA